MQRLLRRWGGLILLLALLIQACSSLIPPESCIEGLSVEVDEEVFSKHFRSVALISASTGRQGELGEDDLPVFSSEEELILTIMSRGQVSMFACVQEPKGSERVVAERVGNLEEGPSQVPLGRFEEGSYIARVIVGKVLVRNLPFEVVEPEG